MNANIEKFQNALSGDKAMQGRFDAAIEKYKDVKPDDQAYIKAVTAFADAEGYKFTEAELAEVAKSKIGELSDDELGAVAGGYVGKEKYSLQEYNQAGVSWQHNIWSYDEYYVRGVKITQKQAEMVVEKYQLKGSPLTDLELRLIGISI